MRIYVACLASYNRGDLFGRWIDLDDCLDADDLKGAVQSMLDASPVEGAEEFAIHDFEAPCDIHEYESLDSVWEKHSFFEEHGRVGEIAMEIECGNMEYAKDLIDNYSVYEDKLDLVIDYIESSHGQVPEYLVSAINLDYVMIEIESVCTIYKDGYDGDWYLFW